MNRRLPVEHAVALFCNIIYQSTLKYDRSKVLATFKLLNSCIQESQDKLTSTLLEDLIKHIGYFLPFLVEKERNEELITETLQALYRLIVEPENRKWPLLDMIAQKNFANVALKEVKCLSQYDFLIIDSHSFRLRNDSKLLFGNIKLLATTLNALIELMDAFKQNPMTLVLMLNILKLLAMSIKSSKKTVYLSNQFLPGIFSCLYKYWIYYVNNKPDIHQIVYIYIIDTLYSWLIVAVSDETLEIDLASLEISPDAYFIERNECWFKQVQNKLLPSLSHMMSFFESIIIHTDLILLKEYFLRLFFGLVTKFRQMLHPLMPTLFKIFILYLSLEESPLLNEAILMANLLYQQEDVYVELTNFGKTMLNVLLENFDVENEEKLARYFSSLHSLFILLTQNKIELTLDDVEKLIHVLMDEIAMVPFSKKDLVLSEVQMIKDTSVTFNIYFKGIKTDEKQIHGLMYVLCKLLSLQKRWLFSIIELLVENKKDFALYMVSVILEYFSSSPETSKRLENFIIHHIIGYDELDFDKIISYNQECLSSTLPYFKENAIDQLLKKNSSLKTAIYLPYEIHDAKISKIPTLTSNSQISNPSENVTSRVLLLLKNIQLLSVTTHISKYLIKVLLPVLYYCTVPSIVSEEASYTLMVLSKNHTSLSEFIKDNMAFISHGIRLRLHTEESLETISAIIYTLIQLVGRDASEALGSVLVEKLFRVLEHHQDNPLMVFRFIKILTELLKTTNNDTESALNDPLSSSSSKKKLLNSIDKFIAEYKSKMNHDELEICDAKTQGAITTEALDKIKLASKEYFALKCISVLYHYCSSSNVMIRCTAIEGIIECFECFETENYSKEVDPLIHTIWPSVITALKNTSEMTVYLIHLKLLKVLAFKGKGFMKNRFNDIYPLLLNPLRKMIDYILRGNRTNLSLEEKGLNAHYLDFDNSKYEATSFMVVGNNDDKRAFIPSVLQVKDSLHEIMNALIIMINNVPFLPPWPDRLWSIILSLLTTDTRHMLNQETHCSVLNLAKSLIRAEPAKYFLTLHQLLETSFEPLNEHQRLYDMKILHLSNVHQEKDVVFKENLLELLRYIKDESYC